MSEITSNTPEFGSRPDDLAAFNDTVICIHEHNDQFSIGKLMFRAVSRQIGDARRVQDLVDSGVTQEEAEQTVELVGGETLPLSEEEQMARSIVGITNASVLEQTGLTLSPLRVTATMYSSEGNQSVGEVRLRVTDGGLFTNFLLAVDPSEVSEVFQNNVADVTNGLIAETTESIVSNSDAQTATEILAYAKGIVSGLEKTGLADSPVTRKLSALYTHSQQGDITEFVLANNIGLLEELGEKGFGPKDWQRDATTEFLSNKWNDVLDILRMAKRNPNAKELFIKLAESAQASLDYAKADLVNVQSEAYSGSKEYGQGFKKVFEMVELELMMMASPDEEMPK